MRPPEDLARELGKIADTLVWADRHFQAEAAMNAAAHMNVTVRPAPLASSVSQSLDDINRLIGELEAD